MPVLISLTFFAELGKLGYLNVPPARIPDEGGGQLDDLPADAQTIRAPLAHAVLREDAGFHAYQMLEAGVRQFAAWGETDEGRNILIAVTRYLAAHSPTERAALQTADIARRLMRGGELHLQAGA